MFAKVAGTSFLSTSTWGDYVGSSKLIVPEDLVKTENELATVAGKNYLACVNGDIVVGNPANNIGYRCMNSPDEFQVPGVRTAVDLSFSVNVRWGNPLQLALRDESPGTRYDVVIAAVNSATAATICHIGVEFASWETTFTADGVAVATITWSKKTTERYIAQA